MELLEKLARQTVGKKPLKGLPESPGVYVFFKDKTPVYIGKAVNLKRRVSSYFDLDISGKTKIMVSESNLLSFVRVNSELESLLLEARLIRKYMPKYNIAAKDDKHPLYIKITKEKYPRIITARKIDLKQGSTLSTFGPFPSSTNVRSVLRMLRRIFPYSDHKLGKRGCLYSHIGLCSPCPNEIVQSTEYKVLRKKYLSNISHLKSILSGKFGGVKKELEKEMKDLSQNQKYEDATLVRDQINRLDYITQPQTSVDAFLQNPNLYEDIRQKELSELKDLLTGSNLVIKDLKRIECFDIAHLSGKSATASMVTFIDGEADKKFYRHFRIRQNKGNSDVDSLREVIKRRINHLGDWGRPNLIIVDGGVAQVKAFTTILYSNVVKIPVVGIAKNPDRLVVGNDKIRLQGGALHLVTRMRDEAHRFARRYHHVLISRSLTYANDH